MTPVQAAHSWHSLTTVTLQSAGWPAGRAPAWKPLGPTTSDATVLLPLSLFFLSGSPEACLGLSRAAATGVFIVTSPLPPYRPSLLLSAESRTKTTRSPLLKSTAPFVAQYIPLPEVLLVMEHVRALLLHNTSL